MIRWIRLARTLLQLMMDEHERVTVPTELCAIDDTKAAIICAGQLWNPFPKLQRAVSGGNGDNVWALRDHLLYSMTEYGEKFNRALNLTRERDCVRHSCRFSSIPLLYASALGSVGTFQRQAGFLPKKPSAHKSVTIHIREDWFNVYETKPVMSPVISSVIHRWVVDKPLDGLGAYEIDQIRFTSMLAGHLIWNYTSHQNEAVSVSDGTNPDIKLEIYAFGDPLPDGGRYRNGTRPTREQFCDETKIFVCGVTRAAG